MEDDGHDFECPAYSAREQAWPEGNGIGSGVIRESWTSAMSEQRLQFASEPGSKGTRTTRGQLRAMPGIQESDASLHRISFARYGQRITVDLKNHSPASHEFGGDEDTVPDDAVAHLMAKPADVLMFTDHHKLPMCQRFCGAAVLTRFTTSSLTCGRIEAGHFPSSSH